MTFLYEVYRLIPENIKTKSLLKTSYNKMRVSLGSLCFDSPRGVWILVEGRGSNVEGEKLRVKDKMSRVTNKYSIKVLVYHFRRQISCFFLLPC